MTDNHHGLSPRAAHTAVYIHSTDSLYIWGGFNLNHVMADLQIYSFTKSQWENEYGEPFKSAHNLNKVYDNEILRELLLDPSEINLWGLPKNASFFRNFLLTYSNPKVTMRYERSAGENLTISEPEPRYGHAAASLEGILSRNFYSANFLFRIFNFGF